MSKNKEHPDDATSASDENVDKISSVTAAKSSSQPPDAASTIGGWMIAMLWVIGLGVAAFAAQGWLDTREERREGVVINGETAEPALRIRSNRYGQYRVRGSANDEEIIFLIDTGASGISIPADIASRLGLRRGRASRAVTANGTITVYATRIDRLSIGPFSQTDVAAHINPAMEGDMALLGMSFLRQYELVQRDGELTISSP